MEDKTRGYGGQDIVLPDETRRAIAELVNGDAPGVKYAGNDGGYGRSR